ncbi:MAG: endo-1,4-beta-xylanase [Chitinispirillaceae bacterium]|nr:endo-1,4-beta-xylanase [Chitinispirillaceae bacterium]
MVLRSIRIQMQNPVRIFLICIIFILHITNQVFAQPAKGANKFLGNITTRNAVRSDFLKYWNQITGENESKWASVEGTRDRMNWGGTDKIAAFAKENNIPWKFHTLVWGSQYPSSWMNRLSQEEQLEEVTEWFDEAAKRYPDVQMIDVINEAYESNGGRHAPPPTSLKNALGGTGKTGYDWMIKAFKMARERWPNAVLIYNDYNTIEWNNEVNWQVNMAKAMKAANAPMDAIGVQAHDAWKVKTATVKSNIDKIAAVGYPIFVTEYDIGESNDAAQKRIMEEQFTMFWNHPKIVGVTYWGYIVGSTWRNGTGLLNSSGSERPALTWLINYVKKNPNPPNDFMSMNTKMFSKTAINKIPFTIVSSGNSVSSEIPLKVYDLQGRVISSRFEIGKVINLSPLKSAHGCYLIDIRGYHAETINTLQ